MLSRALAAVLVAGASLVGLRLPVPGAPTELSPLVQSSSAAAASPALPSADDPVARRTRALEVLLAARATALVAGDAAGWMAGVDPSGAAGEYAERQRRVFERLAVVPLASWRWEFAGAGGALPAQRVAALGAGGDRAWVAHVVLVHQVEGGGAEVRRDQYLTVVPDPTVSAGGGASGGAEGWLLASDADGPTAVDLWDLGPVSVARGERSVVIGAGPVQSYVPLVDEAARRVDEVWGRDWPRTTLVEVPADQAGLAALLGRGGRGGLDQVAAVTTGETTGGGAVTTGNRVVINPDGFATLADLGRRVVLTHELTHVATRATTRAAVPPWLGEGYAEWMGYRGSGLERTVVAGPLLAAVREGRGPTALADADDFDPALGDVASAYSGSWLAVEMLVTAYGDRAVTDFYREVASVAPIDVPLAGGASPAPGPVPPGLVAPGTVAPGTVPVAGDAAGGRLEAALRTHFGIDEAALVTAWRSYLDALAQQPGA